MDELVRQLAANGAPIWLILAFVIIYVLSSMFPKVLGPISEAIYKFTASRRQAAVDREDADIAERDRMIKHLSEAGEKKDARINEQAETIDAYAMHFWVHRTWEWKAKEHLPPDFPPPPPTFPKLTKPE